MTQKLRFESLPWLVRQGAVAAVGWRNRNRRFGEEYKRWTEFLADSNEWDVDSRNDWQRQQLLSLLTSARTGTVHYAQWIPPIENIQSLEIDEILRHIPVLEKQTLRRNPNSFKNNFVEETSVTSTSGSTGSPMKVGHDDLSIQRRFAILNDHLRLAGISLFDPSVRLSGRILCEVGKQQRKPWLYNSAERQLFLSSYHLDEAHAPVIVGRLKRMAPVLMDGYPSGILEVLRLLKKEGCKLDSLNAIITTAETLSPELRQELTELSGAEVMDYYGASEGLPLIQQCQFGKYHVRWQSGIFEVDDSENIGPSGDGELICTSFVQDRTPLIRYRTGDLVQGLQKTSEHVCRCGLNTPTVENVQGRVEDMIQTHDGRTMGMFTYRTLKGIEGLRETQVIQRDYADFEVNGVINEGVDAFTLKGSIKNSFERALGYPIKLEFNRVNSIPRGPNGKVRLVISKIAKT